LHVNGNDPFVSENKLVSDRLKGHDNFFAVDEQAVDLGSDFLNADWLQIPNRILIKIHCHSVFSSISIIF
jgi:hypothetical protein